MITATLDADVHKLNTKLQPEPSHPPSVLTLFLFSSSFYADCYDSKQKKTGNAGQSVVFPDCDIVITIDTVKKNPFLSCFLESVGNSRLLKLATVTLGGTQQRGKRS